MLSVLRSAWIDGGDMSCPGGDSCLMGETISTLSEFLGCSLDEEK